MIDTGTVQDSSTPAGGPARTGLVAFAATAAILLGGTAALVAATRWLHPETFAFAPRLLDRTLGIAAAAAMLAAAVCGAAAAGFAAAGRRGVACALLAAASVAGLAVLVVRVLEAPSAGRNAGFVSQSPARKEAGAGAANQAAGPPHEADAVHGKSVFFGTCAACHGPDLTGLRGQGANLIGSEFVKSKSDSELLAFVKIGRQPFDPESKLHLAMPSKGGNPALREADLIDTIAFVRQSQKAAPAAGAPAPGKAGPANAGAAPAAAVLPSGDQPSIVEGSLWLPHSVIPMAAAGPAGVEPSTVALQRPGAESRAPATIHSFFTLLLFAHALEAFYVLAGIALGSAAAAGVARRVMKPEAVALVAGYWVLVAALSFVTAPLLYWPS